MRLLDLLDVIDLTTRQYREAVSPDRRLDMMKAAFPRPDLLSWFDGELTEPVLPQHYFPLLAGVFAWHTQPKLAYRRLILCGAADGLLAGRERCFSRVAPIDVWTFDADGRIPPETVVPSGHEVGLVVGAFERGVDLEALVPCLRLNFYHATRLFLLADEAMAALDRAGPMERPLGGARNLFERAFCHWGSARWTAIYVGTDATGRVA